MRLGAFDINEPVPELKEPHAIVVIRPWVNVGNVGTLVLSQMEAHFDAIALAKLAKPGDYFDFTRYRPNLYLKEGRRELEIPNVAINYSKRTEGNDFLFIDLLEPHMLADEYIDSVLQILKQFGVKRFCIIGSMYDMIPYTRPLMVSAMASNEELQRKLKGAYTLLNDYQGPTTIAYLIALQAIEMGIETLSLVVHLPRYFMLENDYRGVVRLGQALNYIYDFPLDDDNAEPARQQEEQAKQIAEQIIEQEPGLKLVLKQLEANYDARVGESKEEIQLSPEIEKFLQDLYKRYRPN